MLTTTGVYTHSMGQDYPAAGVSFSWQGAGPGEVKLFSNATQTLTLSNLPAHAMVSVTHAPIYFVNPPGYNQPLGDVDQVVWTVGGRSVVHQFIDN